MSNLVNKFCYTDLVEITERRWSIERMLAKDKRRSASTLHHLYARWQLHSVCPLTGGGGVVNNWSSRSVWRHEPSNVALSLQFLVADIGDMNKNTYQLRSMYFQHMRLLKFIFHFVRIEPVDFMLSLPLRCEVYIVCTSVSSLNPSW
jgi:hypothetical protein